MTCHSNKAELAEVVNAYCAARDLSSRLREELRAARLDWEEEHAEQIAASQNAMQRAGEIEENVRSLALRAYEESGRVSKAVAPGIGIRMVTRIDYVSETAERWAAAHGMFMHLDDAAFQRAVRAGVVTEPWVRMWEEPQVTLAKDLSPT